MHCYVLTIKIDEGPKSCTNDMCYKRGHKEVAEKLLKIFNTQSPQTLTYTGDNTNYAPLQVPFKMQYCTLRWKLS